jgi:hypothetical protein
MTEVRIPFTASSKFNETTLAHDLDRLVNYTGRTEVVLASFSARLRAIETNCTMVGVAVVQAPKLDLAKTTAVIKNTTACAVYPPTADSMCRPAPKILYCGDTFVGSGTVHAIRTRGKTVAISNVTNRNTCLPNPYGVVVGVMDVYADVPAGVVVTVECV